MTYIKILLIFAVIYSVNAQDTAYRTVPNNAFSFGERLSFEISYGFITAAESFINISPAPVIINGRETFEVNFEVNSRSSFDIIYKVRDNYKTFIDTKGMFPWKFEQHVREQNYKRDVENYFLPDSQKVNQVVNYTERRSFQAPKYVQDIFSAMYYVRTQDLRSKKDGDVITLETFDDDKHFPLTIRIVGREEVDVSAGEFRTIIVKPELQSGFTSKTSDIFVYLSDDDRKIPVKVKMNIVIGALVGELTEYSGLNGPLDAKIGD
jgi:hypothetical protein